MSSPSSPLASRARVANSRSSRLSPASATLAASTRGTITTPSSSATTTSPGTTWTPAHTTGTLTEPRLSLTVPLAEIVRDQTGKAISVISPASRQPMSITTPRAPRALSEVASSSPTAPSELSLEQATTSTSPGWITSTATWIIQLSPGWQSAVTALPATRAPRHTGRRYGCMSPVRRWASCTVATPRRSSDARAAGSARRMLRTTTGVNRSPWGGAAARDAEWRAHPTGRSPGLQEGRIAQPGVLAGDGIGDGVLQREGLPPLLFRPHPPPGPDLVHPPVDLEVVPVRVEELDRDLRARPPPPFELERHPARPEVLPRPEHLVERVDFEGDMVELALLRRARHAPD